LFSPVGMAGVGLTVGIYTIINALNDLKRQAEEARAEWERLQEQMTRARQATTERVETAAEAAAKAGVTDREAITRTARMQRKLIEAGYGEEAIGAVLPFVARFGLETEEAERLAALTERFGGEFLEFKTIRQMPRVLARAQREAGSRRRRAEIEAWIANRRNELRRERERVAGLDPNAIARQLQRMEPTAEALTDEEIKQAVEDILAVVGPEGRVTTEGYTASVEHDRLMWQMRQREAVRRAAMLGLVGKQRVRELAAQKLTSAALQDWWVVQGLKGAVEWVRDAVTAEPDRQFVGPGPSRGPAAAAGLSGYDAYGPQGGTITVNNFHGPTFVGGPDRRNRRVVRR